MIDKLLNSAKAAAKFQLDLQLKLEAIEEKPECFYRKARFGVKNKSLS